MLRVYLVVLNTIQTTFVPCSISNGSKSQFYKMWMKINEFVIYVSFYSTNIWTISLCFGLDHEAVASYPYLVIILLWPVHLFAFCRFNAPDGIKQVKPQIKQDKAGTVCILCSDVLCVPWSFSSNALEFQISQFKPIVQWGIPYLIQDTLQCSLRTKPFNWM